MLRGAIGAACPFCTSLDWSWQPVSGKGEIYSYQIVAQAVQPAFADWVPYPVVLVELDEQRDVPWHGGSEDETDLASGHRQPLSRRRPDRARSRGERRHRQAGRGLFRRPRRHHGLAPVPPQRLEVQGGVKRQEPDWAAMCRVIDS